MYLSYLPSLVIFTRSLPIIFHSGETDDGGLTVFKAADQLNSHDNPEGKLIYQIMAVQNIF